MTKAKTKPKPKAKKMVFTSAGLMRGPCGHAHSTVAAVRKCVAADAKRCTAHSIADDRRIFAVPAPMAGAVTGRLALPYRRLCTMVRQGVAVPLKERR